jgi:hypothetical protein
LRVLLILAVTAAALPGQATPKRRRLSAPVAFYDDADPARPGVASLSTYLGYYKLSAGQDLSGPSAYLALGLHPRVDVSGDIGLVHSRFEETRVIGATDSYIGAKILILPEGKRRPALAVKPMIEVLGAASVVNNPLAPNRVNFVPSFVTQKSFESCRLYYMGGYITRGIWFQSLGAEWNGWSRVTPVVIVSSGRVTQELDLVRELGLNRSRVDLAGGVSVAFHPAWSLSITGGRSLGRTDPNSSQYQLNGGVNFNFRLWGEQR